MVMPWRATSPAIVAACVAAGWLGACTEKPEAVCGEPATQAKVIELSYNAADHTVRIVDNGAGNLTRLGGNRVIPTEAVLAELAKMRAEPLLSFEFATLQGVDDKVGRVSCQAQIRITTAQQDRVGRGPWARDAVLRNIRLGDFDPPDGLDSGMSHTTVDYTRQPNAVGPNKWVYFTANASELTYALILIASERAIMHSPDAIDLSDNPIAENIAPDAENSAENSAP